jgi:hypothetical protein
MAGVSRALGRLAPALMLAALLAVAWIGLGEGLPGGTQVSDARPGAGTTTPRATAAARPCRGVAPAVRRAGPKVVFVSHGALEAVDLGACRSRTLVGAGAAGPVRISADRRWVAYGPGVVAPFGGGSLQRPLGAHVLDLPGRTTWAWAPRGDLIAGVTAAGAVAIGRPGHLPQRLTAPGWGSVTDLAFDGPGALVVVRDGSELWRLPLDGGPPRPLYRDRSPRASLQLAAVVGGSAVVWRQPEPSASAAADGAPLLRIDLADGRSHRLARSVVVSPSAVAPCGAGLAVAVGEGREATRGKAVVVFDRRWRRHRIGPGVAPACSADGRTVAYVDGPDEAGAPIGQERRRLLVDRLPGPPRVIAGAPAAGPGAGSPSLLDNGRLVLWVAATGVRERRLGIEALGQLRVAKLPRATALTALRATLSGEDFYGTMTWPLAIR